MPKRYCVQVNFRWHAYILPIVTTLYGDIMGRYVTVSTKVRRELKEEAEKLGVNISEVLRRALREEVKKRKIQKLKEELEEMSDILDKIDISRIVKSIRESRETR